MSTLMAQYWTNFAKYEDPAPPGSGLPAWPATPAGQADRLNLTLPPAILTSTDTDMELFWDRLVWDPRLAAGKAEVRDGLFLAQLGLADQGTEQRR